MAKKRIKGIDIDPANIGQKDTGAAGQDVWWRQASSQGIEFAYLRFFNGLQAPTSNEANRLRDVGGFDRNKMPLGAYCILDPEVDGETQARLFIDYMSKIRGFMYWQYNFASLYKIRPALWINRDAEPSMLRYNTLAWLKTVNEFMCEPAGGNEPLYHDKPIMATTFSLAERANLASDIELRKYHMWIVDESQGVFPKQEQTPEIPPGFKADLWHTGSNIMFNRQKVGFNWSIDLGKKEKEPSKGLPIRKISIIPLLLLGGAIFFANRKKKSARESAPPPYRGMFPGFSTGEDEL